MNWLEGESWFQVSVWETHWRRLGKKSFLLKAIFIYISLSDNVIQWATIDLNIHKLYYRDGLYIYIYLQIIKQLYKYSFSMNKYWCPSSFFLPLNSLPRYLTQFSFYVMESRVSRNCTRNIPRPSTPGKEVNWNENTVGTIAKRRQLPRRIRKFTLTQIFILVKFYSIT